jgi:exodeoxyribonuclease VII small subunit
MAEEANDITMRDHPSDVTFGEALERLEAIVNQLEESEELGLEQALALYEQGVVLAGECHQRLATASLKLAEIATHTPSAADGNAG